MPVFAVRGVDGQVGIVAARNRVQAVERLDEFANFEGCPIRELPDLMLLLDIDDEGEMALRLLGEEMEQLIRRFAYPLLERLTRNGQFDDDEQVLKAVRAERERVRRKSTAPPPDLPSSLIRKYERQIMRTMLRRQHVPSDGSVTDRRR